MKRGTGDGEVAVECGSGNVMEGLFQETTDVKTGLRRLGKRCNVMSTGNLLYTNLMHPDEYVPNKSWFPPNFYVISSLRFRRIHLSVEKHTRPRRPDSRPEYTPKTVYLPRDLG